jgi:hypothetical protein
MVATNMRIAGHSRETKNMKRTNLITSLVMGSILILGNGNVYAGSVSAGEPTATILVSGIKGGAGSALGPGGALFVTESAAGQITRIDPKTGATTVFASGLPTSTIGLGGAMDIAFIGSKAYVLVTLVSADVGGSSKDGIYRMDGPNSFTVIADIGAWSVANPPATAFDVPTGLQYAFDVYQGGFLVSDGHHNRVLRVGLDGKVTEVATLGNVVPTGMVIAGNTVYLAEAGPLPHLPKDGKVVALQPKAPAVTKDVASGGRLLVDVKLGRGRSLFALAQGEWPAPGMTDPGTPAKPNTGQLLQVNNDGTFNVIKSGLNQPTSMEFIGTTAYIVTLSGDVLKIEGVSGPPFGASN